MATRSPILYGSNMVLRPCTIEDLNDVVHLRSDVVNNSFLNRKPPKDEQEVIDHLTFLMKGESEGKWYNWGITPAKFKPLIGIICLWNIDLENRFAELGYELASEYKQQGYMSKSIRLVLEFAFREKGFNKIGAFTQEDNLPSNSILKKMKFEKPIFSKCKNGEVYYELAYEKWLNNENYTRQ